MTTPQQAYEALNTLIGYAYSKGSDIIPPIIHTNDLMNRLKPFVEIMRNELEGKVLKNPYECRVKDGLLFNGINMETFEHYQGRTSGLGNTPSYEEYIRDVGSPGLLDN